MNASIQIPDTIDIPSPIVGPNGNWHVYDPATGKFADTGKPSKGEDVDESIIEQYAEDLANAKSVTDTLKEIADKVADGTYNAAQVADIQYLLDSIQNTPGASLGGLTLANVIAVSDVASGLVTAYLSGISANKDGKPLAMLKAGVQNFGQSNETETVRINHDGTAHFGDLCLEGDAINFKNADTPYLSIGKNAISQSIAQVLNANAVDKTSSFPAKSLANGETKPVSAVTVGSFIVQNDGTKVTLAATASALCSVRVRQSTMAALTVTLSDGSKTLGTITSASQQRLWREPSNPYGAPIADSPEHYQLISNTPKIGTLTLTLPAGTYYLNATLSGQGATGSVTGASVRLVYNSSLKQALFGSNGFRLFDAALKRYIDASFSASSGSFVRIAGGLMADKIEAEQFIIPKVLAHGCVNANGTMKWQKGIGSVTSYRSGTGNYRLSFPIAWTYSDLYFQGNAQGLSNNQQAYVSFYSRSSGVVWVFTGDDSSNNDADFYFQIIQR